MKNKAFTLIELLAVIVILAIIALIATPIILGIIRNAKDQSATRSAELYVKAAELGVARKNLTGEEINITTCEVQSNGNLKCGNVDIEVDMDKTTATGGKITFNKGKIIKVENLHISDKYCNTDLNNKLVCTKEEGESTGFTGTIYRNSTERISIGQSIAKETKQAYCGSIPEEEIDSCAYGDSWDTEEECLSGMAELGISDTTCSQGSLTTGLSSYETEETKSNIEKNYYLKHVVENNIVKESYACINTEETGEVCVRGGGSTYNSETKEWSESPYYGTYDGMSSDYVNDVSDKNPTGNIAIISSTRDYFLSQEGGSCTFNDSHSGCRSGALVLGANSDGNVHADDGRASCDVSSDGASLCG